jgi:FAD/FMN-containing dehydrogenase
MSADEPLIYTGTLSQSPGQFASIWALREGLTECVQKEGKPYKYDVSVPLADFQNVVDAVRERMISKGLYGDDGISKVMGYGHIGDGEYRSHGRLDYLTGSLM